MSVAAQSITQRLEQAGVVIQKAPIKGRPRVVGQTADRLTLLEVQGPLASPSKIVLTGIFARDDDQAARRNGQLMSDLLNLVLPTWQARGLWLVAFLREAPQRKRELVRLGPLRVELRYNGRLHAVTMTIWIGGPSRDAETQPAPTA